MARANKQQKRRRNRLFREHPFCHFCDCRLVLIKDPKVKYWPDNSATIEHRKTRLDPTRGTDRSPENLTVLACRKCNQDRGRAAEIVAGIEELRRRSGYFKRFEKKEEICRMLNLQ